MTDQQHTITPPQELLNKWRAEGYHQDCCKVDDYLYCKIAQWGWQQRDATVPQELQEAADQQLDKCCNWLDGQSVWTPGWAAEEMRSDLRPEPPSLKEQALGLLNEGPVSDLLDHEVTTIRRALESLPE